MKTFPLLLVGSALVLALPLEAQAQSRYSTPPAITLSPDLTAPWVLQLEGAPQPKRRTKPTNPFTGMGLFKRKQATPNRASQPSVQSRSLIQRQKPKRRLAYNRAPQQKKRYTHPSQRPLDPQFLPQTVNYVTTHTPGTIIIDTSTRHLYLVQSNGTARRYGVGVGKQGFEWSGTQRISRKAEWPSWTPPTEMIIRERKKGRELPAFMPGGPENPMGARALYLGSTLYRIHGTNQPWTIGQAVSSGCIRMRNEDVMDLYERARTGAKVIVT